MADASGLRAKIINRGDRWAVRTKDAMVEELRRAAPVGQTGELARTIRGQVLPAGQGRYRIVVEAPAPQASWTDKGTRPHVIRPRSKKALAFNWPKAGGSVVFAKVNHPGTKGTRWWSNTWKRTTSIARQALNSIGG
jgi:hypothetical protein